MRILLLNDLGTTEGGAEIQIQLLQEAFIQRGHEVRILTSRARRTKEPYFSDAQCPGSHHPKVQPLLHVWNPGAQTTLKRLLREFRPHVVHVRMFLWQLSPSILPLLRDVPAVYQTVVYKSICPTGLKVLPDGSPCQNRAGWACLRSGCISPATLPLSMLQLRLWRRWRHVFDVVCVQSHRMARILRNDPNSPIEPLHVVHNGIREQPARPPLSPPPTVGFAGRLTSEKGLHVLLDAMALLRASVPDARLLIAGRGPDEAALRAHARTCIGGSGIEWLGYLPPSELDRALGGAWVQAVPALWEEPFGNVATEAMMRGTAVVASQVGGLADHVVHGQTGYLVTPGDPRALADGLRPILQDRSLAEGLGAAGRQRALQDYTVEACIRRLLALYQQAIQKYRPSHLRAGGSFTPSPFAMS